MITPNEFLARLVGDAMSGEEQEELELQLMKGLKSGPVIEANDAYWERKQAELIRRATQGG